MKKTIADLFSKKSKGEKLTEIAVYDYPTARIAEEAGIDIFVVGDSLGMNLLGFDDTIPVSVDMIDLFTAAVRRGAPNSFIISDLPFGACFTAEQAYENSCRFIRAGADGIKIEGGKEIRGIITALSERGILVHGHIGLTPQSYRKLGGYKAQGRDVKRALELIDDAKELEEAGAMLILLEAMPSLVAKIITEQASVPILGVGAGPHCDGVAIVLNDFIGLAHIDHPPRYVKKYCDVGQILLRALLDFKGDVEKLSYPNPEHFYNMPKDQEKELLEYLKR